VSKKRKDGVQGGVVAGLESVPTVIPGAVLRPGIQTVEFEVTFSRGTRAGRKVRVSVRKDDKGGLLLRCEDGFLALEPNASNSVTLKVVDW
jgi:hypothetical protein